MASMEHELDDLLAEPIIHLMMRADGVDRAKIYALLARLKVGEENGRRDMATRPVDHPCLSAGSAKVPWSGR